MGYPAVNGVVNQNSPLSPITLPMGVTEDANATVDFNVIGNLDSNATVGTSFSTPVQIYDSLGQSHQMTVTYTKTATNTWSYYIAFPPGHPPAPPLHPTGTMFF